MEKQFSDLVNLKVHDWMVTSITATIAMATVTYQELLALTNNEENLTC